MTDLALRTSRSANAVSRRHGEVARAMWAHHWPGRAVEDVPITHVTNGVHLPTWMAPPMRALLERHLGADLLACAADPDRWARVDAIPDEELWAVRCQLRAELVAFVRARSVTDRLARGEPIAYVERAARAFDPERAHRSGSLAASPRTSGSTSSSPIRGGRSRRSPAPHPLQIVIAGKAHPRDEGAKTIVQAIFALKDEPFAGDRVVFLEDYDLETARMLVAGCDVWVNLPRPPLEASGTSGMKSAMNGGLNLSVLDGWWSEAFARGQRLGDRERAGARRAPAGRARRRRLLRAARAGGRAALLRPRRRRDPAQLDPAREGVAADDRPVLQHRPGARRLRAADLRRGEMMAPSD